MIDRLGIPLLAATWIAIVAGGCFSAVFARKVVDRTRDLELSPNARYLAVESEFGVSLHLVGVGVGPLGPLKQMENDERSSGSSVLPRHWKQLRIARGDALSANHAARALATESVHLCIPERCDDARPKRL